MRGIPFLGGRTHTAYADDEDNDQLSFLWKLDYAYEFAEEEKHHIFKVWDCRRKGPLFSRAKIKGPLFEE